MASVIDNPDSFEILLEHEQVEILETLIILEESSSECGNGSIMCILGIFMTDSFVILPNMHAFNNMSDIATILNVVEHSLFAELGHHLHMEEYDIAHAEVQVNVCFVDFVDPVGGDLVG